MRNHIRRQLNMTVNEDNHLNNTPLHTIIMLKLEINHQIETTMQIMRHKLVVPRTEKRHSLLVTQL